MADRDEKLGQVIADYLDAAEEGTAPSSTELLAQHPEFADDLRSFFDNHQHMQAEAGNVIRMAMGTNSVEPTITRQTDPTSNELPTYSSDLFPVQPEEGRSVEFGEYELLEEIARGGMGVVYRAKQRKPSRIVAIKMILTGRVAAQEDLRRFHAEAEAAANLDHPNIVPVFEVGEHEGRHFFSMGYIDGESLAVQISRGPLVPRKAAVITKQISEAIAYAHERGVIHRDLKPSNILFSDSSPKIADFGLAKRTEEEDGLTTTGQIVGTPAYMSPEQATGKADVTPGTDVYSLGVILYCQLVGRPPFQAANSIDTLRQVVEEQPTPPRQIDPSIPRDLETICMKCLEKDPSKRYSDAQKLADEIDRYLRGVSIVARPVSRTEQYLRWCRRHPSQAGLLATIFFVLLSFGIGGPLLASKQKEIAESEAESRRQAEVARQEADDERVEAERLQRLAEQERRIAKQHLAEGQFVLGASAYNDNRLSEALNWYLHAFLNTEQDQPISRSARNILATYLQQSSKTFVQPETVHRVAMSQDGKRLWASYLMSRSQIWNLETDEKVGESLAHRGDVISGAFSSDNTMLLTCDWECARIWNAETGELIHGELQHYVNEGTMLAPVLSPDGRVVVTRDTETSIKLWDTETGEPLTDSLTIHGSVYELKFSHDSKWVAARSSWSRDETAFQIWSTETGEPLGTPWKQAREFEFHPAGTMAAVCTVEGDVSLWNFESQEKIANLVHDEQLNSIEFDKAGRNLFAYRTGYQRPHNTTAVVWANVGDENQSKLVVPLIGRCLSAKISPNGSLLAIADGTCLRIVQTTDGTTLWARSLPSVAPFENVDGFGAIEFSPDSSAVMARGDGDAFVFSVDRRGWLLAKESNLRAVTFAPTGATLVCGTENNWARVRDLSQLTNQQLTRLMHADRGRINRIAVSPDSRRLVTIDRSAGLRIWDTQTWETIGNPFKFDAAIRDVAISADSRECVVLLNSPELVFIDLDMQARGSEPVPFQGRANLLRFDETGTKLFVGMRAGLQNELTAAGIFDMESRTFLDARNRGDVEGEPVHDLLPRFGTIAPSLWNDETNSPRLVTLPNEDFSERYLTRNGRLVAKTFDGDVGLWDLDSGERLGPLFRIDGKFLSHSEDGRYVLAGEHDIVQIWDALTGKRCGGPLDDTHEQMAWAFDPDSQMLATYQGFYTRIWDCATGQQLGPPLQNRSTGEHQLVFGPDKRWVFSVDGGVQVFRAPASGVDDPELLQLQVEVRTGLHVDENGTIQRLDHTEWHDRKRRLKQLGNVTSTVDD